MNVRTVVMLICVIQIAKLEWTDSGVHGLRGPCVHLTVTNHGRERVTIPHRYMTGEIAQV
ncbi:hypothetical protein DPMN_179987 [Dreissena polymorpha]|uniref:Uncharacterized protein n=1 Tax=Dreissena polymorpha TaxID=45954 RepID=A0A9D4EF46_DREPO|nr:hypothetical protein DPMN_179987 [Dreissena polymorpha]